MTHSQALRASLNNTGLRTYTAEFVRAARINLYSSSVSASMKNPLVELSIWRRTRRGVHSGLSRRAHYFQSVCKNSVNTVHLHPPHPLGEEVGDIIGDGIPTRITVCSSLQQPSWCPPSSIVLNQRISPIVTVATTVKTNNNTNLLYPPMSRHIIQPVRSLTCATLNIRSLRNKIDAVDELICANGLDLLALTETWHEDSNCITIGRLRELHYSVMEEARLIPSSSDRDTLEFINHGGVALLSTAAVRIRN